MKVLSITDVNQTVNVQYTVDLIGSNLGNFTVMAIKGLTDLDHSAVGLNFQKLVYNIPAFKTFCTANYLKLTITDPSSGTVSTLVDATPQSSVAGLPLGLDLI
jgi:hypothetical protein